MATATYVMVAESDPLRNIRYSAPQVEGIASAMLLDAILLLVVAECRAVVRSSLVWQLTRRRRWMPP